MPIDDGSVDLADRDDHSRDVGCLDVKGQTASGDLARRCCGDLDAASHRRRATVFYPDRGADRRLARPKVGSACPDSFRFHPRDQPRCREDWNVTTAQGRGGVGVGHLMTHPNTLRRREMEAHFIPSVDAMKRRTTELTDETVERIVDEAKGLAEKSKRDAE